MAHWEHQAQQGPYELRGWAFGETETPVRKNQVVAEKDGPAPEVACAHGNYLYTTTRRDSVAPILENEANHLRSGGASSYTPNSGGQISPAIPQSPPEKSGITKRTEGRRDNKDGSRRQLHLFVGFAVLAALISGAMSAVVSWKLTSASKPSYGCAPSGRGDSDEKTLTPPPLPTPLCPSGGNGTANSTAFTVGAAKAIRRGSALAVAGSRVGDDFTIRLFYQAPDDGIMISTYMAMYGAWTAPRAIRVQTSEQMMGGGPLAATMIYLKSVGNEPPTPQYELYYLSPQGKLLGVNFRESTPAGQADSVNGQPFAASRTTSLSAFWPYMQFQDPSGTLLELKNSVEYRTFPNITGVAVNSPFLALPLSAGRGSENNVRFFYRGMDGELRVHARGADNGVLAAATGGLRLAIPDGAPLAGFAVARASGSSVDTFVLFQDEKRARLGAADANGGIVIMSQTGDNDGSGNWSGPNSDPVFAGADVPTRLACLTQGVGVDDGGSRVSVQLSSRSEMSRCFFQANGGKLKQVWYDGSKWADLGYIPMP